MKIGSTLPRFLLALVPMLLFGCGSSSYDQTNTPANPAGAHVDAHVGKNFSSDSTRIGTVADRFAPADTVHAVIDVPPNTTGTMDVRWVFGGSGGQTVSQESVPLVSGTSAYRVTLMPPDSGNRPGDYQLEVTLNGDRVDVERFTVSPQ
jgi:hypothetical protein